MQYWKNCQICEQNFGLVVWESGENKNAFLDLL